MNASIYARKSPDHNGIAAEEARSVTRQIADARRFAEARGWRIDEAHVIAADGRRKPR